MRAVYLFFILILISCGSKSVKLKPVQEPITESVYASGIVKARNQYQVYATVSGTVDTILAYEGDTVAAEQIIMLLSSSVQKLSEENARLAAGISDFEINRDKLNDAREAVEIAGAKLRNDSAVYFRQKKLYNEQVGTLAELEQKEFNFKNAVAAMKAAKTRYEDLNRQLIFNSAQSRNNLKISGTVADDYIIRSKINGVMYQVNKQKGELVTPQGPLAEIGDADDFILEMQIDEYDILKIRPGMKVLVAFDSNRNEVFEAKISKVNPLMNQRSKSFTAEAEFVNKPERLFPNTSLEANILVQMKDRALLIPRNALIDESKVVKADGDTVMVKTGLMDFKMVEILSGITIDDELIIPQK